jgi:hypothetical protein
VFETVCHNTKGKSLNLCLSFFRSASISENPREVNDFGDPSTIFFLFNFHSKLHMEQILRLSAALEKDRNKTI